MDSVLHVDSPVQPNDRPRKQQRAAPARPAKSVEPPIPPDVFSRTMEAGNAGASAVGRAATVSGNDELSRAASGPAGATMMVKGIIDASARGKVDDQTVSALATGAGTMLSGRVPGAELLVVVGRACGLGHTEQTLVNSARTLAPRPLAGSIAATLETGVALAAAGSKSLDFLASQGARLGLVKAATTERTAALAARASATATRFAVPFAVVGTALSGWDWRLRVGQAREAREQREVAERHYAATPQLVEGLTHKEATLRTNARLSGASFALSSVSTAALTSALAAPLTAPVAVPVAIGAGIGSAVAGLLAEPTVRTWAAKKLHLR